MPDRFSSFTTQEGVALQTDLGFLALTVVVDNLTASWVYVTAAGRYVPPFTYGATFPLGAGVQVAQAAWATPPGITRPTAGAGQAQLTFTSALLPPSNGQAVVTPSQQVALPVASILGIANASGLTAAKVGSASFTLGTAAGGSDNLSLTFVVPPGANSLVLLGNTATGATHPSALYTFTVTGTTTKTTYITSVTGGTPLPAAFIIASAADGTVKLDIQNAGLQSAATPLTLVASFGTQAVSVENANPIIVGGPAQQQGNSPVGVAVTAFGTMVTQNSAANAAQTITIPAPSAGKFNRLSQVVVSWFGGAPVGVPFLAIQDSTLASLWVKLLNNGTGPYESTFPIPAALITGSGAMLLNVTAGGAGVSSTLSAVYSVY